MQDQGLCCVGKEEDVYGRLISCRVLLTVNREKVAARALPPERKYVVVIIRRSPACNYLLEETQGKRNGVSDRIIA